MTSASSNIHNLILLILYLPSTYTSFPFLSLVFVLILATYYLKCSLLHCPGVSKPLSVSGSSGFASVERINTLFLLLLHIY